MISDLLANRLVNVASLMAAVSLQSMSKEMSAKFKNATTLEEVDELMASFIKYVCHLSFHIVCGYCILVVSTTNHLEVKPFSLELKDRKLIVDTPKLVITRKRDFRILPMACRKPVYGGRLHYWRGSTSQILDIFSLIPYVLPMIYANVF